jgi:hypothetical protein
MFDEKIAALIQRLPKLVEHLQTEEATKNALIMPFIAALGYDVFNPQEVVPEFIADVGTKKGEKVDYAIKRDGEVIILFECKKAETNLSEAEMSQLFRYFAVTKARIAVLTNGVSYWFYSDLAEPNKMDTRPFLELDLSDPRPGVLSEVKKLAKDEFDLEKMLGAANELKFTSEFKKILIAELEQPEEDFVRFFYTRALPGARFTASAKEQFTPLVARAFQQLISDRVSDRLRSALTIETKPKEAPAQGASEQDQTTTEKDGVTTTEEELEAFRIIRAITCRIVPPDRVVPRDTKTYFGVLLDDNNRKPICRLWFNSKQKYLGVFDSDKNETRIPIATLADIYQHADKLVSTIQNYERTSKGA